MPTARETVTRNDAGRRHRKRVCIQCLHAGRHGVHTFFFAIAAQQRLPQYSQGNKHDPPVLTYRQCFFTFRIQSGQWRIYDKPRCRTVKIFDTRHSRYRVSARRSDRLFMPFQHLIIYKGHAFPAFSCRFPLKTHAFRIAGKACLKCKQGLFEVQPRLVCNTTVLHSKAILHDFAHKPLQHKRLRQMP